MNDLLETSRRHLPGTEHWAFAEVEWFEEVRTPPGGNRTVLTAVQGLRSEACLFDEHCEIPT